MRRRTSRHPVVQLVICEISLKTEKATNLAKVLVSVVYLLNLLKPEKLLCANWSKCHYIDDTPGILSHQVSGWQAADWEPIKSQALGHACHVCMTGIGDESHISGVHRNPSGPLGPQLRGKNYPTSCIPQSLVGPLNSTSHIAHLLRSFFLRFGCLLLLFLGCLAKSHEVNLAPWV